jgi:hypothetical protein
LYLKNKFLYKFSVSLAFKLVYLYLPNRNENVSFLFWRSIMCLKNGKWFFWIQKYKMNVSSVIYVTLKGFLFAKFCKMYKFYHTEKNKHFERVFHQYFEEVYLTSSNNVSVVYRKHWKVWKILINFLKWKYNFSWDLSYRKQFQS